MITTAANRLGETTALGKLSSAEASVLLATEPLWAALFAALLLGEQLGWNDGVGGALIVAACLVNAASAEQVRSVLNLNGEEEVVGKSVSDGASKDEPEVAGVVVAAMAAARAKREAAKLETSDLM